MLQRGLFFFYSFIFFVSVKGFSRDKAIKLIPQAAKPSQMPVLKKKEEIKVTLGLNLKPYQRVEAVTTGGKSVVKFKPQAMLKHTLKASSYKENHFYLNAYHVVTKPLEFVKDTRQLTMNLTIYKRFGRYGDVEELIGSAKIAGKLSLNNQRYVLHGATSKRFRNRWGHPVLDLAAGYNTKRKNKGWLPGQGISQGAKSGAKVR